MSAIADNLARLHEQIAAAAERAGRRPDEITLVAAVEGNAAAVIAGALAAGITDIGEDSVKEASKRAKAGRARWHLLGGLPGNNAKQAVSLFDLIQSVDSAKLARTLGRHAQAAGKTQDILLWVRLGDGAVETGASPDQTPDLGAEIAAVPGITLRGLRGDAPPHLDPRPRFQSLRRLFEALPPENRQVLSMVGMSIDADVAVEEGATMVRVDTDMWGRY